MGFKLSCILVNERHDGYIGEIARSADTSKHNRARASETVAALGMAKGWESLGCPTIMTPLKEDQIDIGLYDGACLIDPGIREIECCLRDPGRPIIKHLCRLFPTAKILVATIYDVVNMFGYLYFENGVLVRGHGGGDGEITIDHGDLLPEELEWFDRSRIRDGERVFRDPETSDEYTVGQIGGELTCAVSRRFLGQPFGEFEFGNLQTERFQRSQHPIRRNPVVHWLFFDRSTSEVPQDHGTNSLGHKTSNTGEAVCILCLFVCCVPIANIALPAMAIYLVRNTRGWAKTLAWVELVLGITITLTVAIYSIAQRLSDTT